MAAYILLRKFLQLISNVLEDADEWRCSNAKTNEQDDLVLNVVLRCRTIGAIDRYLWQTWLARD